MKPIFFSNDWHKGRRIRCDPTLLAVERRHLHLLRPERPRDNIKTPSPEDERWSFVDQRLRDGPVPTTQKSSPSVRQAVLSGIQTVLGVLSAASAATAASNASAASMLSAWSSMGFDTPKATDGRSRALQP